MNWKTTISGIVFAVGQMLAQGGATGAVGQVAKWLQIGGTVALGGFAADAKKSDGTTPKV